MKDNMIAIGTVGALSDVPADTENILAWNGGGKANYSEILADGKYVVKKAMSKSVLEQKLAELQELEEVIAQEVREVRALFASE
jgi:cerevisin